MEKPKLNIGVIGCGTIARNRHIPELFENPNVHEIVLGDTRYDTLEDLVSKYKISRNFTGVNAWEEIINKDDIDAVIISTPNEYHAEISIEALNKGKAVLVEKPMATSITEGEKMIEAAEKNNKLLLIAHHRRHQYCYITGKKILKSGMLGKIQGILAQHKQSGPIEWAPNSTWFFDKTNKGGGVMFDIGIHMADIVSWYTEDEAIETSSLITQQYTAFEQTKAIVKMESGIGVVIDVAWGIFEPEKRVTVYCEDGKVIIDEYANNQVQVFLNKPKGTSGVFKIPEHPNNLMNFPKYGVIDHFINCIRGGKLERNRLREHLNALKIVYKSTQNKL